MFKIGDYVVHSGHGVCSIIDKYTNPTFNKDFYKLETIHNKMTIMMPLDKADAFLRPVIEKNELLQIINASVEISDEYPKDNKERKNEFQILVTSNNINDTIKLLKCLYKLNDDKKKEKKTLGSFDTQFLQQAERKLFNEIAISAKMTKEEAHMYLSERLKSNVI